jgi:hypothetical protein
VPVGEIPAGPDRILGAACPLLRPHRHCTETDDQQNKMPDDDFSPRSVTGTVF